MAARPARNHVGGGNPMRRFERGIGLHERRASRRQVLRLMGAGAGGVTAFAIACGGSKDSSTTELSTGTGASVVTAVPSQQDEQARKGGGITVYRTTKFLEHDMHTALAGTVWHLIGNRAFVLEPWKGELQPQLAASQEIPGDGTELIIKVRPG